MSLALTLAPVAQLDPTQPCLRLGPPGPGEYYALLEGPPPAGLQNEGGEVDVASVERWSKQSGQAEWPRRWQLEVSFGDDAHVPFRRSAVWEAAALAVLGGGGRLYFLDLQTGARRGELALPSLFGGLAVVPAEVGGRPETLLALGWQEVVALEADLSVRWRAPEVAVDGVVFHAAEGTMVRLGAEMDPPGGWFSVQLDVRTGRELAREPAFTEEYVGFYGAGKKL